MDFMELRLDVMDFLEKEWIFLTTSSGDLGNALDIRKYLKVTLLIIRGYFQFSRFFFEKY